MDFNYEGRVYIERQNFEGENFLLNLRGYEPKIIKSQKVKTDLIVLMNKMKSYFVLENVYFDFDKEYLVRFWCSDFDETFRIKMGWSEGLTVMIMSSEVNEWLGDL